MKKYIGVKELKAREMTRGDYNLYQGWIIPEDENPEEEGFLVEYLKGGVPNHPDHKGYISWSPKNVFEEAYRETNGITFGLAIEALKKGLKVARKGWNGKDMWLDLVPADKYEALRISNGLLPWIGMKTADNCFVPWLASQTDMLSDDWEIV